ncbi:isochorismatase family protein [Paenibacillus sp. S150]|uniref:isochorismatase family protein n=1 Tax=Paenibacillus sp. S150 TaxID=2749826 RepID=UPI001C57078E|nr:isochorismatase family protein [Paenibacillus sp. S150]MBW4084953.1 isochorismatase family protein [Paenibacillus sp. S150]
MKYAFEDHCWQDIVSDEILEIYKAYHRETFIGKRPALLAIDLYNASYKGGAKPVIELQDEYPSSCGIHAWEAIEPTKQLFAKVRGLGIPVIYSTRDMYTQAPKRIGSTHRKPRNMTDDAYQIFEAFAPQPDDVIINKSRASAFFGTPLAAYLNMMGIDSLIVCGESTSGCVRASVLEAYSYGYHVTLVEECCYDRSPLSHKVNLFDLHHKYADVMHIDEALEHLDLRHAASPSAI